jgi:hypothetical protein
MCHLDQVQLYMYLQENGEDSKVIIKRRKSKKDK